jgi:two-component system OmpR family response regulator
MAPQCPVEPLLLGRMSTEMNFVEILTRIRANLSLALPVLVCTDRECAPELLCLSNTGVDDILCRPIAPGVLIARISAMLGRAYTVAQNSPAEKFGEYRFDQSEHGVFISGNFISLTRKQYDFALLLFRNLSRPVSISHIREVVWNQKAALVSRTIDSHASMIRTKLNLRPRNGYILSSVYRYEYILERVNSLGTTAGRHGFPG